MNGDKPDNLKATRNNDSAQTQTSHAPKANNLQHVGDDAHTPHVSAVADAVIGHNFGRHELRRAEQHLQRLLGIVAPRQAEVDDLQAMAFLRDAQNILRLHVQVQNVRLVHEIESITNLHHVQLTQTFRQNEIVVDNALKKLPSSYSMNEAKWH